MSHGVYSTYSIECIIFTIRRISFLNRLDEILMAAGEMISDNSSEKAEKPASGDTTGSMGIRNVLVKPFR
jgi:hypothetical protein